MRFSARKLFVCIVFVGIFTTAAREVVDPDFWWHLRTGQYILETRSIPHSDVFSFTSAGREWIAHEWLTEVLLFAVFRTAGTTGLMLVFAAIITAAFAVTYRRCEGSPYIAGFALLLGMTATMSNWGVRPQIVTFLLASVYLVLLFRFAGDGQSKRLWWLVPLMLLWVNLHGGYSLGLALLALFAAGMALDGLTGVEDWAIVRTRLRALAMVFAACVAVVPLNPNGLRMFTYPFETLHSAAQQTHILEWQSPNFHSAAAQPFAWLLLLTFLVAAVSPRRLRPLEVLLLCVTGYAGLRSVRHVPIFVLVAVPLLAGQTWALVKQRGWEASFLGRERERLPIPQVAFNYLVLAATLAVGVLRIQQVAGQQSEAEAKEFPAAAVAFIRSQHPAAPMFNPYEWGGYLIWKLYPEYRVFIDGRADMYGDAFIEEFLKAEDAKQDWQAPLIRYGVQTIMVRPQAPLAQVLRRRADWKQVFGDAQVQIFSRTAPAGAAAKNTRASDLDRAGK
jgi:hypothetical protein